MGGTPLPISDTELVVLKALWAHGPGTVWILGAPDIAASSTDVRHAHAAALARVGAFSLSAGLTNLYVAWRFRRQPRELVGFIWAGIAAKVPPKPERPALQQLVRTLP